MLYARFASGFGPGGITLIPTLSGLPKFGPDRTQNYELGIKADLLDRRLSIDVSAYYIDWRDIQLQVQDPVSRLIFSTNGGKAKSQGLEVSAEVRPSRGLRISGWMAWNDAELTEDFPEGTQAYGVKGNRLPNSARFSGHLSLDQQFPLWGQVEGFAGAAVSRVGDRLSGFGATATTVRNVYPSYTKYDVHVGAQYDTLTVNIYADNLTDKRGVLTGTDVPFTFTYIRPRTIGMSLTKAF
jgi:outer membrane receptor protein involved in Fe transport